MLCAEDIRRRAATAAFGKKLVSNMYRGLVSELIVGSALSSQWKHCSEDWSGWDFEHREGSKLEVKQSAARQTWSDGKRSRCSFGIAASQGFYKGSEWIADPTRKAEIYVFAHHPVFDADADHCDPTQWIFYVLPASLLPDQKTVALSVVIALSEQYWGAQNGREFARLGEIVEILRARLRR